MLIRIADRVRRRETPLFDWIYRTAKGARSLNLPRMPAIYGPLRAERDFRHAVWGGLTHLLYYEPMFRCRCASCGRRLQLLGGMPEVRGDLRMIIGDDVELNGCAYYAAGKTHSQPTLIVGDNSHLGYMLNIAVGARVEIGRHVLIATGVTLIGYDSHPLDPIKRSRGDPPDTGGEESIVIGDYAWLGTNALVLKGVTIGEAAVIGAGSVVTHDIPPYTVAVGQPARVVKSLDGRSSGQAHSHPAEVRGVAVPEH